MAGKTSAVPHGVTRAVIAFLLVALFVFVGSTLYIRGEAVPGLLVCIGGVVLGGIVWRDR